MRFAMLLVAAGLVCGACGAPAAQAPREEVWAAIGRLDGAIVAKDRAALDAILEPDFVGVIPSGRSFDKPGYIAEHCQPGVGLTAIEPGPRDQAHVRRIGDVVVINRTVRATRKAPDGTEATFWVFRLEAWRLVDGAWKLVSGQGTRKAEDAQ